VRLFTLKKNGKGFAKEETKGVKDSKPFAFIGVRACEIQALHLNDEVFLNGPYVDPHFRSVRAAAFVVAVDCAQPGGCCFCTSMGGSPKAESGFDIALTEVCGEGKHLFLARAGTSRGETFLAAVSSRHSTPEEEEAIESQARAAVSLMAKHLDAGKAAEVLPGLFDSPAWEDISKRCLACANCTMVCPTCFCSTVEETTDLTGASAERWSRWDSCFTMDYTKVAGGNIRPSTKARYRQWVMHKFSYWIDQFGAAGCVGCGRCITWCPAGIDVTSYLESLCSGQGSGTR
jgi:ferredoxin